jgi:hypothetical protein
MKVTAIIPDELVEEIRKYTGGKNITDSLIIALKAWLSSEKMKELNRTVDENPLEFNDKFDIQTFRERR